MENARTGCSSRLLSAGEGPRSSTPLPTRERSRSLHLSTPPGDEARAALDAMKFPPIGHRGYGLGSIITDFKGNPAQSEIASANRETLAVMMVESREGLEAVEEIGAVPEIDVLFIGPYDLSLSLGIIEQFDHPLFEKALEKIINAGKEAGLAVGLQSGNSALLKRVREMGVRFLICGSESSVLLEGYKKTLATMKA